MQLSQLMNKSVVTVTMDDSLRRINNLFAQHPFHHLLVIESKKLVGVISDRDLLKHLSPNLNTPSETQKDAACLNKRAHQIMSRNLVTLTKEATLMDAIEVLDSHSVSCIPIVTSDNKLEGIITWRDIFKLILKK